MEPDDEVLADEHHTVLIEQALWEYWREVVEEPLPPKILMLLCELARREGEQSHRRLP
ncbi:hypothetical protein [Alsobacter sp. SYSU BS001988]